MAYREVGTGRAKYAPSQNKQDRKRQQRQCQREDRGTLQQCRCQRRSEEVGYDKWKSIAEEGASAAGACCGELVKSAPAISGNASVNLCRHTAPGARHFLCTGRIWGVSTFSHRVCMTRSIHSSNKTSDAFAMCFASRSTAPRTAGCSTKMALPAT